MNSRSRTLELSKRQRERFDRIKAECTDDGNLPKPSDGEMLDSLMDTWDAVGDGFYADMEVTTDVQ